MGTQMKAFPKVRVRVMRYSAQKVIMQDIVYSQSIYLPNFGNAGSMIFEQWIHRQKIQFIN